MSMVKRDLERFEEEQIEESRTQQERTEELIRLRTGLREAVSRLKAIAEREEPGSVKDLYKKWEMEARQALEGI